MFKITCMVEDKALPKVLRSLAADGAYEVKPVPVANAEPAKNGQVRETGQTAAQLLSDTLRKHKKAGSTLTIADVKDFLKILGMKPSGAGRVVRDLLAGKRIKKIGHGKYEVLR